MNLPDIFTAKTDFGLFRIKITNRDYISIGANNNCLQIAYDFQNNTANLDWLGTEKSGCELSGKTISGIDTIKMTDLGFTILRQMYPSVHPEIKLRDTSSFKCSLPDGNAVPILNMPYHLLIKGKTYYQDRFNATLFYPESEPAYLSFKENWETSPLPDNFDFKNRDLNSILKPILQNSNTWKEFFTNIYAKYGRKTCSVLFPWYLEVFGYLAKQAIHSDWKINISNRPIIHYEIIDKNSSRTSTMKSFKYDPYSFSGGFFPSKIPYKNYLKFKNRGITLKKRLPSKS